MPKPTSAKRATKAASAKRAQPAQAQDAPTKIVEAALEEFALLGFEGASLPSIAKRAGVKHPLIHYHFGDKERLWRAAVEHAFAPLSGPISDDLNDLSDASPMDTLKIAVRRFILYSARHPYVGMLVSRETMIGGPRLAWLAKTLLKPLHRTMSRVLAAAVESNDIKPLPEANVIQALAGAVVQFYSSGPLLKVLYNIDPLDPVRVQEHADVVLDLFIHGLRRR